MSFQIKQHVAPVLVERPGKMKSIWLGIESGHFDSAFQSTIVVE
jgi:hypothetical protein